MIVQRIYVMYECGGGVGVEGILYQVHLYAQS